MKKPRDLRCAVFSLRVPRREAGGTYFSDSTQAASFLASASLTWGLAGMGTGPQTPLPPFMILAARSEEHTSELKSQSNLVCRLLLEKKKKTAVDIHTHIRVC